MMESKQKNKLFRRCVLCVFYDPSGIVDPYVEYYLNGLRSVAEKIRVIVNGSICPQGLEKLKELADVVQIRDNTGLDIAGWREGMEAEGFDSLSTYDEVILCNTTVFGPIYPFSEMFDAMMKKDVDFWGITAFHGAPDDLFGFEKLDCIPKHIQSYFQVYRKRFIQTKDFKNWWKSLSDIKTYEQAVERHEAVFTKKMEEKGYRWAVYCDTADLEGYTMDPLRDFPRYLLETKHCPVIKRRSFFHDYGEAMGRSTGEAAPEAFSYIRDYTDYDTDLICQNLIRTENMADIRKRMHLNYVLTSKHLKKRSKLKEPKTAMVMHIYYPDQAEICAGYASQLPESIDCFITVPDEKTLEKVKPCFETLGKKHKIDYRITGNRGRDLGPFFLSCKDVVLNYDLILKVHDKKVAQLQPMSIGESWRRQCFASLMQNETFIQNIITLFTEHPRMGMLVPPVPLHGPYFPTTGLGEWGPNFDATKALADKLGLNVPICREKEPVAPIGSMCWIRTDAIKSMFEHTWQESDFPEEPLAVDGTILHALERVFPFVVQNNGYYTGWVMSDNWARIQIDNWNYLLHGLINISSEKTGWSPFLEQVSRIRNE